MHKPYQGCANHTSRENDMLNGYVNSIRTIGYSSRVGLYENLSHHRETLDQQQPGRPFDIRAVQPGRPFDIRAEHFIDYADHSR